MSTSTFLGTPLTKYEIDDIETDLVNKKAREFEKEKGLQYRQTRERLKRNRPTTLYTVDTKEGFVPSNFKSSKAHRASYTQQEVSNFTDLEDSDIISKNTLKAIKIDRASLQRNIASIVSALGFMGKRRFIGPMNIKSEETRISRNLEGVGFNFDLEKETETLKFVRARNGDKERNYCDTAKVASYSQKGSLDDKAKATDSAAPEDSNAATGSTGTLNPVTRHANDRQYDLSEIQLYYKHLYSLIVKSIEVKEELAEKVAKGIEFTKERTHSEKKIETGRRVESYTFDDELLQRFRLRNKRQESADASITGKQAGEEEVGGGPKLPAELFRSIFGE